jgi:hypothetical protein
MYTLETYDSIHKNGFQCVLPDSTLQIIRELTETVTNKSYSLSPNFIKPEKETTPIQECTELLNKITNDNFTVISYQLLMLIDKLPTDQYETLIELLFSIVSTNLFYSEVYATLYEKLYVNWEIFRTLLLNKINIYLKSFDSILSYDSSDYDNFCKMKLSNDHRKAFTLFLYHLMHKNICNDQYVRILQQLYSYLNDYIVLETKKESVIEIIEHIYLLKPKDLSTIQHISTLTPSIYPGLSNKAIFRCMDILEELN